MPYQVPHLTFRTDPEGGEVRTPPKGCPGNVLTRHWHIILLIHGYNNNEEQGREAYAGFRSLQRELGNLRSDQPVAGGMLVEMYWPGDVGWISSWNYPDSLVRAKSIASALAQVFQRAFDHSGLKLIDIVAHSLGCRLALELISHLNAIPGVYARRAVFLAAAVPTFMLEQGTLRDGLNNALMEGIRSLYSPDDWVLRYGFPNGQERSGPGEYRDPTVALGSARWQYANPPGALDQRENYGAGHSDYWGWDHGTREVQGRRANLYVREFLGFADAGSREVLDRWIAGRATAPERVPDGPREIDDRAADGSEGDHCLDL